MGSVSCLGVGAEALWAALASRACGIRPLARLDTKAHRIPQGGEVRDFPLRPDSDEATQFAIAAATEAACEARLDRADRGRAAVVLGTNFGAATALARFLAAPAGPEAGAWFRLSLPQGPTEAVAGAVGMGGPRMSLSLSCASGNAAVQAALGLIRSGAAEVVLAGGYDAITDLAWSGLAAMRTMTTEVLRPFDRRRQGTIFSEGAGVVVVESLDSARRRGAAIRAEVLGAATDNNAYHMAHPDPDGAGMVRVLRAALADARVAPDEVDYVSAHGTGTPYNDKFETIALKRALGDRARAIPVSGLKSMLGHAMGAASSLELIATVCALGQGVALPTIHLEEPDPNCDLDYVADGPRPMQARTALCNSAGIGGPNAAVVLRRWEEAS
jgi:3-oxoacyl-[acyl-carrier-protein] synthase II